MDPELVRIIQELAKYAVGGSQQHAEQREFKKLQREFEELQQKYEELQRESKQWQRKAENRTKLINKKILLAMIPLSDRTIYDMEKRGEFPRRIVLTKNNVMWDLEVVEAWIAERKASNDQAKRPGSAPLVGHP